MNNARIFAMTVAAAAFGLVPMLGQAQTISACVQRATGDMRILAPGAACPRNSDLLEWNQQPVIPPPPTLHVQYMMSVTGDRAFCPPTWKVVGGGALTVNRAALIQSFPISTTDGVIAHDTVGIGWLAQTEDGSPVQVFAICAAIY